MPLVFAIRKKCLSPYKKRTAMMTYSIQKTLEEFTQYLTQVGYSKGTIRMLPRCVREFLNFRDTSDLTSLTREDILDFYHWLHHRPTHRGNGSLSEVMIRHYMFSVRIFFNWLETNEVIFENPVSALKFKQVERNTREPLSKLQVNQLFEQATTLKETALLHLFYSCGLRRAEGENLNIGDIHFSKNLLYVREGKGAKRRVIPLTQTVKNDLLSYYENERQHLKMVHDKTAFMLNNKAYRLRGNSHYTLFKKILSRTDLPASTSLHHLRHSIATHLLENGLSLEFVRDFLGHAFLESTQIYAKVNTVHLK